MKLAPPAQEARRLMLGENMDAAGAGFQVGYSLPSHFSHEYKNFCGAPPQRDLARLRGNLEH
jgi:AraC-like DNA-binding protein